MGGAVGEIHGAKIAGTLARAIAERPRAVLFLIDSGGVRLHEANAGLIAISEIMRAVLDVRAAGVPVVALVGGLCGAFGGMGIVARLCSHVIMSEEGRLALSGPDVIETVAGVEEFDARDRALVWRVTGGKHRLLTGDCDVLVEDDIAAFRAAAVAAMRDVPEGPPTLGGLRARQAALAARARNFAGLRDGLDVWRRLGVPRARGRVDAERAGRDGAGRGGRIDGHCDAARRAVSGRPRRARRRPAAARHRAHALACRRSSSRGPRMPRRSAPTSRWRSRRRSSRRWTGRPCRSLFLVDTSGQALSRHEEVIGLNAYLAHVRKLRRPRTAQRLSVAVARVRRGGERRLPEPRPDGRPRVRARRGAHPRDGPEGDGARDQDRARGARRARGAVAGVRARRRELRAHGSDRRDLAGRVGEAPRRGTRRPPCACRADARRHATPRRPFRGGRTSAAPTVAAVVRAA